MKHAIIEIDALIEQGKRHDFEGATPPDLSHKNPPLKWVPVVQEDKPVFDPLNQKLVRATTITADEVAEGWDIVTMSGDEIAAAERKDKRETMRDSWATLPVFIRGAFAPQYAAANALLDAGDDEAALAIVSDTDPNETIKADTSKLATFEAVKSQFVASISAL